MPDTYINREAVRREACKGCTMWGGGNICHDADPCEKLIAAFLNAPAADVAEVVRCKNCKWFADNNGGEWYGCQMFYVVRNTPEDAPKPDDFCSYGELQTNGGGDNKCL